MPIALYQVCACVLSLWYKGWLRGQESNLLILPYEGSKSYPRFFPALLTGARGCTFYLDSSFVVRKELRYMAIVMCNPIVVIYLFLFLLGLWSLIYVLSFLIGIPWSIYGNDGFDSGMFYIGLSVYLDHHMPFPPFRQRGVYLPSLLLNISHIFVEWMDQHCVMPDVLLRSQAFSYLYILRNCTCYFG